jgi:hypothetical protein
MKNDPIVEEIHKIRREYAARFDHDIDKMIRDINRTDGLEGHPVVHLGPRRIKMIPAPDESAHEEGSQGTDS